MIESYGLFLAALILVGGSLGDWLFQEAVGHLDMNAFQQSVATTRTWPELEKVVSGTIGSSGLMEFACFDLGEVLRKDSGRILS